MRQQSTNAPAVGQYHAAMIQQMEWQYNPYANIVDYELVVPIVQSTTVNLGQLLYCFPNKAKIAGSVITTMRALPNIGQGGDDQDIIAPCWYMTLVDVHSDVLVERYPVADLFWSFFATGPNSGSNKFRTFWLPEVDFGKSYLEVGNPASIPVNQLDKLTPGLWYLEVGYQPLKK